MTSNHKEYSNDRALENLKFSIQIYWGVRIFAEKLTNEPEVIKLAFSNFLLIIIFSCYSYFAEQYSCVESFAYVCYHQLCSPATVRKILLIL